MEKREFNLNESFEKGIRNIYQIATYIILTGNLLDLLKFSNENSILLYSNTLNILIITFFIIGFYLKKIPYKICFSVLIYSILINIYLGKFVSNINIDDPLRIYFFMRDSLFVMFLIALAAFALHKIHSIIIGISYIILILVFSLYINNVFLTESALLVVIVTGGFIGLTHYLVSLFEKALFDLQENSRMIAEQNEILKNVNGLMKKRQQTIEEQAESIKEQSEKLVLQTNELTVKNHELNRLNDSKNMFFSIIAHDLKNPFSIILGYAELLKKKYQTLTDEKRTKYIELIESTSLKTHNLLDNLLNWARSQTGNIQFSPEMIILNDIIQEVLDLYDESIRNKSIEIDYSPDLLYEVYADKEMIGIVIRNLVSNAIKFSYTGGKISITISDSKDFVHCSIKDFGVGIEHEDLDKLFDIDKHLSSKGTSGETGSGLGLILCKIFVELNNGELFLESHVNEGSNFSIKIPAYISNIRVRS